MALFTKRHAFNFFCHSIYSNIIIIAMFRIMLDD